MLATYTVDTLSPLSDNNCMKRYVALIILLGIFFIPLRHVRAYVNLDAKQFLEAYTAAESGDINSESMIKNSQGSMWMGGACDIGGICTLNPKTKAHLMKRSALAQTGRAISFLYINRPADTRLWLADVGRTLGFLPKTAYAQGTGFTKLAPLLELWKAFRNVAYLLMAIVMVIIGFMVMFRKKIDPKTVVTIQNALPRIIVTLILITFSYAIVGLLIDLMYVLIALFASIVASSGISTEMSNAQTLTQAYTTGGLGTLFNGLISPTLMFFGESTPGWVQDLLGNRFGGLQAALGAVNLMFRAVTGAVGDMIDGENILESIFEGAAEFVGSPLLLFLLSIAALFAFVRVFFMLLSAYINILFGVIIGPIQILLDAVPGGNGFMSWLKNMLSNMMVFPVTALLLMIGSAISAGFEREGTLWVAPFLPSFSQSLGKIILSIGVALAIPTIVASLKEQFKAKPAVPVGMGAALAPLGTGMGMGMNMFYQASFIKSAFRHGDPKSEAHPLKDTMAAGKKGNDGIVVK